MLILHYKEELVKLYREATVVYCVHRIKRTVWDNLIKDSSNHHDLKR